MFFMGWIVLVKNDNKRVYAECLAAIRPGKAGVKPEIHLSWKGGLNQKTLKRDLEVFGNVNQSQHPEALADRV
jgi:hypothetical protein